jgi:hypothetical protein
MRQRRLLVTGAALLLSILTYICTIALIQPSVVLAHAYVIGSDPVMDMGTGHALITGGNPVYAAMFDLDQAFDMAGFWAINVEIQRPNQRAVQATFQVMLS